MSNNEMRMILRKIDSQHWVGGTFGLYTAKAIVYHFQKQTFRKLFCMFCEYI